MSPSRRVVAVMRHLPDPGVRPLTDAGVEVVHQAEDRPASREELLELASGAQGLLTFLSDRVDGELFEAAPSLRVVSNLAVGYDNVDLEAAARHGVIVTNTPGVLTETTADMAWALMLGAARRVIEGDRWVRSGEWPGWGPSQLLGRTVHGRTLGIFGMGSIGRAVARRASGFGMDVLYHNRRRDLVGEAATCARYVSFGELLEQSDFLCLTAPLTDETHHAIDADALAQMRPDAVLVNVGRGPLIDEAALVHALADRRIAAAGLDVFEREPELADGLAGLENAVLVPHLGSATHQTRADMVRLCCDNLIAVLRGRDPLTPVDPTGPAGRAM
ncbi:MAG: D-glycerate dehydrogenase [Actinomycetota bacterium]|nr:D-glycerate dehydrogenase [Actinomycetota bacterium]